MRHNFAMQPEHLGGRWQYVSVSSHGGYPSCGCVPGTGHDTREEAERHHYETVLGRVKTLVTWDQDCARRCEGCKALTQRCLNAYVDTIFCDESPYRICLACFPDRDDAGWIEVLRTLAPFQPNIESWES
jgi:hypothetical protein